MARRLDVRLRYTRGRTLGDLVSKAKLDKVEDLERGGVVYMYTGRSVENATRCTVYVGETARRANERKQEHERDLRQVNMRSAISERCHTSNHQPDFDSFRVLDVEKDWRRRKIKESLFIMANRTFNRDGGVGVDRRWNGVSCDFYM